MTEIMTLSGFKKAIEEWCRKWNLEAVIEEDGYWTVIRSRRRDSQLIIVAMIYNKKPYVFNLSYGGTMDLEHETRKELSEIITKFASTMPVYRKDNEKKYLLRFRSIGLEKYRYLNYDKDTDRFGIGDSLNTTRLKTHFTLKEVEELKNKLDSDLRDFEIVEVEE